MLIRLIYCSLSHGELPLLEIQRILDVARNSNAEAEVTGMLSYEAPWFLQALEGERETVNELYLKIAEDPRHDDIVLIAYDVIETREFGAWTMGFAGSSAAFKGALSTRGYSKFEPLEMEPEHALEFLKILSSADSQAA